MTPRTSISRLADDAPVPHPDSWPARQIHNISKTGKRMKPEWPVDAQRAAHNQTGPTDEERAFVEDYLAKSDPIGSSLIEMEKSFDRIRASNRRLEAELNAAQAKVASHDRLLSAAKRALVADDSDFQVWADLKAAVAAAEESEP